MDALEKAFHASVIRELMEQYDSRKAEWIKTNGTDAGFDTWFTKQVKGLDCGTCHGLGYLDLYSETDCERITCPECDGRGTKEEIC